MMDYDFINIDNVRYLSEPVTLNWLGWKATTADLIQHGWDFSARQNVMMNKIQLAMRMKSLKGPYIYGISEDEDWPYRELYGPKIGRNENKIMQRNKVISMSLSNEIIIRSGSNSSVAFDPIDPRPTMFEMKHFTADEFLHFKKIPNNTQEILLQEASMEEVLHFALQKQEGRQTEIREEMMRRKQLEEYRINSEPHAELRLVI